MILYNVTVNVDASIEEDWIQWMKETHIPEVLNTGCFVDHKFFRLLNDDPEATGTTYAIQYFSSGHDQLNEYLKRHAGSLQKRVIDRFQDKFVAFRTFLEEV